MAYTIFDIEQLEDVNNQDKLLLILEYHNNNELSETSILDSGKELLEYSTKLLGMESEEFTKYLVNMHYGRAVLDYDGRLKTELIPRLIHIYQLIAARAKKNRIKFFYDQSFLNYIRIIDFDTLRDSEIFAKDLIEASVEEIYSAELIKIQYNGDSSYYLSETIYFNTLKPFEVAYVYKYTVEDKNDILVQKIENSRLSLGSLLLIALFYPTPENLDKLMRNYFPNNPIDGAMILIRNMTYSVLGYNAAYKAPQEDLDKLIETLKLTGITCAEILGKSGFLVQDQFSLLMRTLIHECGEFVVFNAMSEKLSLMQQPYKTRWGL